MIPDSAVNIWQHTKESLYPLYDKRAAGQMAEMDCHAQAAEIYAPFHQKSDSILDAGCGSGYFYHSLAQRNLLGCYYALDYTLDFLEMGKKHLPLPPERFMHQSLEETPGQYDIVFCLNTLFCLPDFRQGLERLLLASKKLIIIRSTFADQAMIRYENDDYLDDDAKNLKSYFNIFALSEVRSFMEGYGFKISSPQDLRCQGQAEISAGKIFPWQWLVGLKR